MLNSNWRAGASQPSRSTWCLSGRCKYPTVPRNSKYARVSIIGVARATDRNVPRTLRSLLFKVTIFCELVVWRILRVLNFTLSPHAQVV